MVSFRFQLDFLKPAWSPPDRLWWPPNKDSRRKSYKTNLALSRQILVASKQKDLVRKSYKTSLVLSRQILVVPK